MAKCIDILHQVKNLTIDEQIKLMEELAIIVRRQKLSQSQHSILKLEGLGKDIWQGVDAHQYVD